ncbi:MAG: LysR family transcriptional regulator [Cypionkella sp.]|nr:LysR family transcriptional regulator [Cypionkella sp.]
MAARRANLMQTDPRSRMPQNATVLLHRFTAKAKFRHLQVLVKLAELQTMRRTAEAIGITQPAVTQLVAELETLMGAQLFLRHARGVHSTRLALDLLPIAARILDALGDSAEVVAAKQDEYGGVVRVAATPAAIGGLLHAAVPKFAEKHPRVHMNISEAGGSDPFAQLAENRCDLLCLRETDVVPKGWIFQRCLDDALVVVCGHAHALSRKDSVTLDDLAQSRWLLNRVGSVARTRFEDFASTHGWPDALRCAIVMHIPSLTFEMLANGRFLALIPRSAALPWIMSGAVVALDTPMTSPLRPLGYLQSEHTDSPAIRAFAAALGRL